MKRSREDMMTALRSAEFPMPPDGTGFEVVHGLPPVALLKPTPYYLEPSGSTYDVFQDVVGRWSHGVYAKELFKSRLATDAQRVGVRIFSELVTAAHNREAKLAVTVGRMVMTPGAGELALAVWDDGVPYSTPEDVGQSLRDGLDPLAADVLANEVHDVHRGSLSVLSGDVRTDMASDRSQTTQRLGEPIVGNLVVVHLPHVA